MRTDLPKTLCTVAGVVPMIVGAAGSAKASVLGMHLTPIHNAVHFLSGAAMLLVGSVGSSGIARTFCIAFGAVYLLLGILGFVAPAAVAAIIGYHLKAGANLLPDNVVHLLLGGVFLLAGLTSPRVAVATA